METLIDILGILGFITLCLTTITLMIFVILELLKKYNERIYNAGYKEAKLNVARDLHYTALHMSDIPVLHIALEIVSKDILTNGCIQRDSFERKMKELASDELRKLV